MGLLIIDNRDCSPACAMRQVAVNAFVKSPWSFSKDLGQVIETLIIPERKQTGVVAPSLFHGQPQHLKGLCERGVALA